MKYLRKAAGLQGHYTNHSLRATAAKRLSEAGVDEQLITQCTGPTRGLVRCVTSDVLNSAKKGQTEKAPNTNSSECEPKCSSVGEKQFPVCEPQCSSGGNRFSIVNLSGATNFTINFNLS